DADLPWIETIAAFGDRSIELEDKKSNYQAGTDFENISRQSLEFLGFNVENAYKGGAGGLDLYCSQPYPLVCECKAGKSIPSGTVQELIKLGGMHLGTEQFINSAKLVIGPGNATSDNLKSSKEWKVSIIKAMTLQKLVELKAKYPGAINLLELKQYLEPGQIDDKINEYISKIEKEIKLRSHIILLVKRHLEKSGATDSQFGNIYIAYL
ncbi:MAG: restriction endonuclease, partial [Dolichospermum sp.]